METLKCVFYLLYMYAIILIQKNENGYLLNIVFVYLLNIIVILGIAGFFLYLQVLLLTLEILKTFIYQKSPPILNTHPNSVTIRMILNLPSVAQTVK